MRATIPLHAALPHYMAPEIRYEQPLWHARVAGRRLPTITVSGSSRIDAKFRAAAEFGCHVQIVVVEPAYDPKRSRFGVVA